MSINRYAALGTAILFGVGPQADAESVRARYIMGTVCEFTVRGPGAAEAATAAFEELERWDKVLSPCRYKKDSEACRMNREAGKAPFKVSESLWEAVTEALEMARRSEGAFDPTLRARGYERVRLDKERRTVFFEAPGLQMDFSGIGKGLALDHAAAALRRRGVGSALLNFGGQVYALGPWTIRSPAGPLEVRDASVSTSGDAERPGHIIDPATGRPVQGRDATVVAPTAAEADAWSTALYVTAGALAPAFEACPLCRYYKGEEHP